MKTGKVFVYGGSAILLGIVMMSGGCKSPEVLQQHAYIPAPVAEPPSMTAVLTPAPTQVAPLPVFDIDIVPAPLPPVIAPEFPPFKPDATVSPAPEAPTAYTVKRGDTLWGIARRHSVNVADLATYNNMRQSDVLQVGKVIQLPPGASADIGRSAVTVAPRPTRKPAPPAVRQTPSGKTYIVKKGDSLSAIASRFGVKTSELAEVNSMKLTDTLQIGQNLVLPSSAAAEKTAASRRDTVTTTAPAPAPAPVPPQAAPRTEAQTADDIIRMLPEDNSGSLPGLGGFGQSRTRSVEVPEDTTVEQFAARNGLKADEVRKLNPEIDADGRLRKGDIVTIPE